MVGHKICFYREIWLIIPKLLLLLRLIWIGCFGFNGPSRQYLSLPERGRKRREKIEKSKNVQTPPPAPTARAIGPCPTIIQIEGRPGPALEVYPGPSHHLTTHSYLEQCIRQDILLLKLLQINKSALCL